MSPNRFKPSLAAALLLLGFVCARGQAVTNSARAGARRAHIWSPDNGDGTYKNPVIHADYSDPDAVRVGDDFYMTASSFNAAPGLPILHSKDLVNWKLVGHVFKRQPPFEVFDKPQHGNGVWAPAIRYHKGEFYIFYPDPDFGIYLTKAKNPAGPWSEPLLIKSAKGWIDPCPFWDDDGRAYLVHAFANSRAGVKSILHVAPMSPDGTRLLGESRLVFDGRVKLPDGRERHPTIEGPKLHKRNGFYYIFAPAGGVATGWQTVLRAKNIWGPYEDRIVMDQGATAVNGPHQGAWVETASGEDWFIHFQDRGPYGRIVHLQPMKWVNDWPVIGTDPDGDGKGEPVMRHRKPNVGGRHPFAVPQTSDEFEAHRLGLQWQWHANDRDDWASSGARRGWLRLNSVPYPEAAFNLWPVPNLLLQKLPAPEFTVTTRLAFDRLARGERAGLVLMGMDYSYLAVERTASGFRIFKVACRDANKDGREVEEGGADLNAGPVFLRVKVSAPDALSEFSYSRDGRTFVPLGRPFKAREGRWIGAKVGLFALAKERSQAAGHADFDWFRFE